MGDGRRGGGREYGVRNGVIYLVVFHRAIRSEHARNGRPTSKFHPVRVFNGSFSYAGPPPPPSPPSSLSSVCFARALRFSGGRTFSPASQPASQKRNFLPTSGPPPTTCENRLAAIPSGARNALCVSRAYVSAVPESGRSAVGYLHIFGASGQPLPSDDDDDDDKRSQVRCVCQAVILWISPGRPFSLHANDVCVCVCVCGEMSTVDTSAVASIHI